MGYGIWHGFHLPSSIFHRPFALPGMSLRLEMLQVARLAPKLLGESATLVHGFLLRQQNADGGFNDRGGKSDPYYTVFGLEGLSSLQIHGPQSALDGPDVIERTKNYLRSFGDGAGLDFVHLCSLARCWAAILTLGSTEICQTDTRDRILRCIESYRTGNGGYNPIPGAAFGTAYGAFLALGAYQDLNQDLPEPLRLVQSLKTLETTDGAWTNERTEQQGGGKDAGGGSRHIFPASSLRAAASGLRTDGATNATAAAANVLRNLRLPLNLSVGEWLLAQAHPQGGFLAAPGAPLPDLLSTATALHTLAGLQVSFAPVKEPCLDFIDTLWTNEGGFYGHWGDDHLDCEYTYYGLLALGHLSLC